MAKIIEGTPEELQLIHLIIKIDEMIGLEEGNQFLILVCINTTEKLKQLEDWLETKMVDGVLETNEIELMNVVCCEITPTEEFLEILDEMEEE